MTTTATDTKQCPHCQQHKPVDAFALRRRGGTARQGWCRSCVNQTRRDAYAAQKGAHRG